jgi:hypothetical protein
MDSPATPIVYKPIYHGYEYRDVNYRNYVCLVVWLPSGITRLDAVVQRNGRVLELSGYSDPQFANVGLFTTDPLEQHAIEDSLRRFRNNQADPIRVVCRLDVPVEVVRQVPEIQAVFDPSTGCKIVYVKMGCVDTDEHYARRAPIEYKAIAVDKKRKSDQR